MRALAPLAALVVLAGCSGSEAAAPPTTTPAPLVATTPVAITVVTTTTTTTTTTVAPTSTTEPKIPLARALAAGDRGDEVRMVQERLRALAFDPGEADGEFGPMTTMAVWAYQKLVLGRTGGDVDGVVTPEVWDRMQDPLGIVPRRPGTPDRLEVLLPQQVALLYRDGDLALVTHVSTGSGASWCAKGWCGVAVTPGGVYEFTRRVDGWRESKLGRLYKPVYFNHGIAVHGFASVPNGPASKGCVRIPMHIAEYFPDLVRNGDAVFVFDGVREPEDYGAQPPPFDTRDPDWVEDTTTTVAPTTVAPTTAAPPTAPAPTSAAPTTPAPTTPAPTTAAPTTAAPTTVPATTGP